MFPGKSREWTTVYDRKERSESRIKTHGIQRQREAFTLAHGESPNDQQ